MFVSCLKSGLFFKLGAGRYRARAMQNTRNSASFYEVCEMMEQEGFRYGSMIGQDAFQTVGGC